MNEVVTQTYCIPENNIAAFEDRIADLNKRARRLKVAEIAVTKAHSHTQQQFAIAPHGADPRALDLSNLNDQNCRWVKDGDAAPLNSIPTGRIRNWFNVTVTGEAPKFAGWKLVAVLEPVPTDDGKALNLMQTVPGETCPSEYRNRIGQCDHCNTHRRRNQTFVVQHDNGSHKMIGRQCIKDFLGHANPHSLASLAELLVELQSAGEAAEDDEWFGGGYVPSRWTLKHALEIAAAVISNYGWVSSTRANDSYGALIATRSRVSHILNPPQSMSADIRREWREEVAKNTPNEQHKQDAEAAIEWARNFDDNTLEENNYLANINAVARMGYVEEKTLGLAVSIVSSYQREQSRLKQAESARQRSQNYVGTIGERVFLEDVLVEKLIIMPDRGYGSGCLHKMVAKDGSALAWFASPGGAWLEEGKTYTIKATVVKHEEYKGIKQTQVNRVSDETGKPQKPVKKKKDKVNA